MSRMSANGPLRTSTRRCGSDAVSVILAALVLAGCNDVVVSRFATLHDAKEQHAFERGWLPPILPESATNIVERNHLSGCGQKCTRVLEGLARAVPEWGSADLSRAPELLLAAHVVRLGPIRGQLEPGGGPPHAFDLPCERTAAVIGLCNGRGA